MSDRASIVTTAVLLTIRRALEEARPEVEAILRDEFDAIRRETFREARELDEAAQHD